MKVKDIEILREGLQKSFNKLVIEIDKIQIGNIKQFPYGWRKANKGRTVWRIVEEVVTQNLEKYSDKFNLTNVTIPDSEVGIYDIKCSPRGSSNLAYVNVKTALLNGKIQKDDISKADKIKDFYTDTEKKALFIAIFFVQFNEDLSIEINKVNIFPVDWISDIYVNPSNNGNLQSKEYKSLDNAVKRTSEDFYSLLLDEIKFSNSKKAKAVGQIIKHPSGKRFQKQESKRWKELTK